jgi:hypothetical protein
MAANSELQHLNVSLTKHGAHKIATLLKSYDRTEILNHLDGSIEGVNIDRAQALKNLSADTYGVVPGLWNEVRTLGENAIDGLVLIAIISSHKSLIEALKRGAFPQKYKGEIQKGLVLNGKEYTNFKHTLVELGYEVGETRGAVKYDFSKLFKISRLNVLAAKLFTLKLKAARWNQQTTLEDELITLGFHKAFSIDSASFRAWISSGTLAPVVSLTTDDEVFFEGADEKLFVNPFVFVKGHVPKKIGKVKVSAPTTDVEADLLHNAMQTTLYQKLEGVHGENCVGTENSSGSGTSIDLVVQTPTFRWFYEIKTSDSVKACIRQAIPQLLEYAYWQGDVSRASKLIIVGPKPETEEGAAYLLFLRKKFSLPFYYEQCPT